MPFLYPLTHRGWERPYVGAGLALYDAMAMAGKYDMGLPRHRHLTRRGALRLAPDLRPDALTGAIRYYDAQVDDARLVTAVARTAAGHGAHLASRTKVVGFLREGERVTGARAVDLETGREIADPRPGGGQRRRRLDRRHPAAGGRPRRRSASRPARGSTSSYPVTGSASRPD